MTGRGMLLAELERMARNCCMLGRLVEARHLEWRPQPNMRSLIELANHLAQIPLVDLRILSGAKQEEVHELEDSLWRDNPEAWCTLLREGYTEVRQYMEALSFDQYENGSGTAYYGRTQTNGMWLLEIVTHLTHHRAQLFMYLKLNGYPVNTRTLSD